jgi:F0F1-type ATP synthase assembly protein I
MSDRREPGGRFLGDVLTFGWVLPAAIAAGAGLGWGADHLFHCFPILTILGGLIGMAAGMRQLLRESDRLSRGVSDDESDEDSAGPPQK